MFFKVSKSLKRTSVRVFLHRNFYSMTKILLLASGRSIHATKWANALAHGGLQVTFFTAHELSYPLNEKVKVVFAGKRGRGSYLLALLKLRGLVKKLSPDIVHSHSAGGYGFLSAFSGAEKRVVSLYGYEIYRYEKKRFLRNRLLKKTLFSADMVLSTSSAMADETLRLFPGLERPLITPFGVDLELFQKRSRQREDVFRIGSVRALKKIYGLDVLIKAFDLLMQRTEKENIELHIAGTGPEAGSLRSMRDKSPFAAKIFFHGNVSHARVPAFLDKLDVFVAPSRSESFGVAVVEACAMELPVVVTRTGGLPEVVDDGRTGLVVPPEDSLALSEALLRLLSDEAYRATLGSAGRVKVMREYAWDKNVENMLKLYATLLSSKKRCHT